jgi:uncharacterized membrane protein
MPPAAPTPPTTHRAGPASEGEDLRGAGLVEFAGILIAIFGIFNIIDGIAAIAKSHAFTTNAHYIFGNLRAWGWVVLLLGILQLVAVGALARNRPWARWFAIVVLALNTLTQLMNLPSHPIWSVLVIAANVVALYGLSVYGGKALFVGKVERGPESGRGIQPPV